MVAYGVLSSRRESNREGGGEPPQPPPLHGVGEQSNTETASRTCGGTLAGFNVPAPVLFCRIRAPAREERERAREKAKEGRRKKERGRARRAMLFLFTHPLYQHSESRFPKVYGRTNAREREERRTRVVRFRREISEVRPGDASAFRLFRQDHPLMTIPGRQVRRSLEKALYEGTNWRRCNILTCQILERDTRAFGEPFSDLAYIKFRLKSDCFECPFRDRSTRLDRLDLRQDSRKTPPPAAERFTI